MHAVKEILQDLPVAINSLVSLRQVDPTLMIFAVAQCLLVAVVGRLTEFF